MGLYPTISTILSNIVIKFYISMGFSLLQIKAFVVGWEGGVNNNIIEMH